jgi:hypothetical protein
VTCPQPTGSCCGFTENIDGEEEYGCEDDLTFLECLKGSALNKPRSWLEDSLCSEIDCNINNEYLRDGFVFGCGDCLENSPDGCCCFIGSGDTPTHGGVTFATIPHYKFWNTGCSNEGPTAFIDDQNEPWCQDGGCEEASFYIKGYPCINFCPEGKQLLTQCGGWYRALDLSIKPISWDCISGSNGQPCPKCIGPPHSERGSIAFIMNRIAKNLKNKP